MMIASGINHLQGISSFNHVYPRAHILCIHIYIRVKIYMHIHTNVWRQSGCCLVILVMRVISFPSMDEWVTLVCAHTCRCLCVYLYVQCVCMGGGSVHGRQELYL